MPQGRGRARNVGSPFWEIVNASGARLSVFNHDRFPHIMDGARVQFVDNDDNGIAEHVQSVADVDRIVALAATGGRRFGRGARQALTDHIVIVLSSGPEGRGAMESRAMEIGTRAAESDDIVSIELLRECGVGS